MYVNGIVQNNSAAVTQSMPSNAVGTADFGSVLNSAMGGAADLDTIFERASEKYNVPVRFLKAVAKAESNFSPNATSSCGAMGIMQLMPATAKSLGVSDPYNPEQSIMGGAKFLGKLLSQFGGSEELAAAAYNAGPGSVQKYNGVPPFSETQSYVNRVMGYCGETISAGSVQYEGKGVKDSAEPISLDGLTADSLYTLLQIGLCNMQMNLFEGIGDLSSDDHKGSLI